MAARLGWGAPGPLGYTRLCSWLVSNCGGLMSRDGSSLVWIIQDSETQKGLLEGWRRWIGLGKEKTDFFFRIRFQNRYRKSQMPKSMGITGSCPLFLSCVERSQMGSGVPACLLWIRAWKEVLSTGRTDLTDMLEGYLAPKQPSLASYPQCPVTGECLFLGL